MKTKTKPRKIKFKIEHGIPIPAGLREPLKDKYPLRKLKVGDSFFVPERIRPRKKMAQSAYVTVKRLRKEGVKIKITIRFDPLKRGTRIWRVK